MEYLLMTSDINGNPFVEHHALHYQQITPNIAPIIQPTVTPLDGYKKAWDNYLSKSSEEIYLKLLEGKINLLREKFNYLKNENKELKEKLTKIKALL